MAKNFYDVIAECEAWPHSRESYEMMKECAELELAERFLGDQEFMQEHGMNFGENVTLESTYFNESVDEGTMQAMYEKTEEKAKGLKTKIWNGIQRIIRAFKNLIAKIGNKVDDVTRAGQKVRAKLEKAKLEDAEIKKIESIVASAKKKAGNFKPMPNQPYLKHVKMNYTSTDASFTDLRNWLAAGLSDDVVIAEAISSGNLGAMSVEDIKDAMASFKLDNKSNLSGCIASLTSSFADAKKNGIRIRINTKSINQAAKDLEEIEKKIAGMIQQTIDTANGNLAQTAAIQDKVAAKAVKYLGGDESDVANDMKARKEGNAAAVAMLGNQLYGMLNATIGASMNIYLGLNNYRTNLISGLNEMLKDSSESKDDKK